MSPIYQYQCNYCSDTFELIRPMAECSEEGGCPRCGQPSRRKMSTFLDVWPWILTEASHHKGAVDTWVQNKPSNDTIVDNSKAPYTKTHF